MIAVLVFVRALGLGFVGYDDPTYVTANEVVKRGLSGEGLAWALGTFHGSTWLPLTWLSHMLDVSLFGLEPTGHHAVSIVWHALNAALAFLVLRRLTGERWPALAAAALWALHPLRVESVAWVASRKDLVSGTFFLLTLWAWLRWTERPSPWRYLLCALFLALGLAAKQVLVTVPFLLLVLDAWPLTRFRARSWSKLVLEKLPILALVVVGAVVAQRSQAGVLDAAGPEVAVGERLTGAVAAYGIYLRQTLWPSGLCVSYPTPGVVAGIVSMLVLVAVTTFTVAGRRRTPAFLVGWLWFLGVLVPMLGLVRFGYYQAHADRFTYVAQLGLVAGLVLGARQLASPRRFGRPLAVAAIVGALALASCTWQQIGVWRDDGTLWRHALACADTATARHNLAEERRLAGETAVAIEHLERAVELDPDYGPAVGLLGVLYSQTNRPMKAVQHLTRATELLPDDFPSRANLGTLLVRMGRGAEAIPCLERALEIDPEAAPLRMQLASLLAGAGRPLEGAAVLEPLAKGTSPTARARLERGRLLGAAGSWEEAIESLEGALELRPGWPLAAELLEAARKEAGLSGSGTE